VALAGDFCVHLLVKDSVVPAGRNQGGRLADGLVRQVAGDLGKCRVDGLDDILGVGDHDAFERALEHLGGQALVLLRECQAVLSLSQCFTQLVNVVVFDTLQQAGEGGQAQQFPGAVGDAEVANVFLHEQRAGMVQAVIAGDADERAAGQRADVVQTLDAADQTHDIAFGEDAVVTLRVPREDGVQAAGIHFFDGVGQRGVDAENRVPSIEYRLDLAQGQVVFDALVDDDVALRDHTPVFSAVVQHQEMPHFFLAKAQGGFAQEGAGEDGFDWRTHVLRNGGVDGLW